MVREVEKTELLAWVGEDEHGSGEIGIKIGIVAAGRIPLAAIGEHQDKIAPLAVQMQQLSNAYGKTIRLVRYRYEEVLIEIKPQK